MQTSKPVPIKENHDNSFLLNLSDINKINQQIEKLFGLYNSIQKISIPCFEESLMKLEERQLRQETEFRKTISILKMEVKSLNTNEELKEINVKIEFLRNKMKNDFNFSKIDAEMVNPPFQLYRKEESKMIDLIKKENAYKRFEDKKEEFKDCKETQISIFQNNNKTFLNPDSSLFLLSNNDKTIEKIGGCYKYRGVDINCDIPVKKGKFIYQVRIDKTEYKHINVGFGLKTESGSFGYFKSNCYMFSLYHGILCNKDSVVSCNNDANVKNGDIITVEIDFDHKTTTLKNNDYIIADKISFNYSKSEIQNVCYLVDIYTVGDKITILD
jgi:hypothetical protein